jgi:hypothetical protein
VQRVGKSGLAGKNRVAGRIVGEPSQARHQKQGGKKDRNSEATAHETSRRGWSCKRQPLNVCASYIWMAARET